MISTSTLISAIDDFRLVRMRRQSAISKPRLKSSPQRCGLVLCAAVANRIVGIALEWYVREIPAHPHIERIMKKKIRQERAAHSPNAKGNFGRPLAICRLRAAVRRRQAAVLWGATEWSGGS
jgi:hypothetical protein